MSAATPKIRARIRKLLALASSPNDNEAARASETANKLMSRHGLTMADFEEDVVEVADDQRDDLRQRLAAAVGVSRRCSIISNRRGQIAFRGKASAAASAAKLYKSLIGGVSANCEVGPRDPGRQLWRLCYWLGFLDAVIDRLIDDEARAWQPPKAAPEARGGGRAEPEPEAAPAVVRVEDELAVATTDFAARLAEFAPIGVYTLKQDAYHNGYNLGKHTHIEAYSTRAVPERSLGDGQETAQ